MSLQSWIAGGVADGLDFVFDLSPKQEKAAKAVIQLVLGDIPGLGVVTKCVRDKVSWKTLVSKVVDDVNGKGGEASFAYLQGIVVGCVKDPAVQAKALEAFGIGMGKIWGKTPGKKPAAPSGPPRAGAGAGPSCPDGWIVAGGQCKRRLLAWNQGAVPPVIGGIPCTEDVGGARCVNGALSGRYLWDLTQQQVEGLNAGLYELLVDLPTAEAQVAEWRRIARQRLRDLGVAAPLVASAYGVDGERSGDFDARGHTIRVASGGGGAAGGLAAIGSAIGLALVLL